MAGVRIPKPWGTVAVALTALTIPACGLAEREEGSSVGGVGAGGAAAGSGGVVTAGDGGHSATGGGTTEAEGGMTWSSGGAGGSGRPPTIDGVPIGDCRDPSPANGPECPPEAPPLGTACSATSPCAYGIHVSEGRATQVVFFCHGAWDAEIELPCGEQCRPPDPNVIEFPLSCAERTETSCEDERTTYAFPTAQQQVDTLLSLAIEGCLLSDAYGHHFQLELSQGCPVRLSTNAMLDSSDVECLLGALAGARWVCARDLACLSWAQSLL